MANEVTTNKSHPQGRRGPKWVVAGALVAVLSAAGLSAWAQHGPGGGMGGMGGMGMFGGPSEHMGRMVDHMLDGINASDAQRAQVKQIAQAAAADLKAQREASRSLRDKGTQIFAAPNVDAAAAEQVRQQTMAQADQASRRVLQAMLDISKVLTPEQRAKLGDRIKQRGDMMRDHMQRMERDRPSR